MLGKFKGQAAMEYLMTYGWALLVIVIVIAVLMWINPFKAPPQCIFDEPGFACTGTMILQTNGQFYADIVNGNYRSVKIEKIALIRGRDDPTLAAYQNVAINLKQQGSFNTGDPKYVILVARKADGTLQTFAKGDDFSGRLYIAYHYTDDDPAIVPAKIVGANIVTRAQ